MLNSRRFTPFFLFIALTLSTALVHAAGEQAFRQQGDPEFLPGGQTGRGYITTKMQSAPGGAYLTVEVVQDRKSSPVRLLLAFDGQAYSPGTPNWELTKGVSNGSGFKTRFEFFLNYDSLKKLASKDGASAAQVAPGKSMVVIAEFPSGHRWGGTDRSGIITLPKPSTSRISPADPVGQVEADAPRLPGLGEGPPATSLDVGQLIDEALAEQFAPLRGRGGLEVGGQIRSRVEAEGKFQLSETEFLQIRKRLFEIAASPTLAKKVLGANWSLKVVDRYMKKSRNGKLTKDADGFPIPDPMIDTYYDTANLDAAKNDVAIRYRWTEGNQTGNWNFKPGIGRVSPDGIVYRVEYAVDATDNKPQSIEVFADSMHPLNFFQLLREIVPGVRPGTFFHPSIRLTDDRYKFALQHKNGLIIEVSLDRVLAERLIKKKNSVVFFQLEMDVEHVATEVQNTAPAGSNPGDAGVISPYASLHIPEDVRANSPTLETQAATFTLATDVIKRLRDDAIGENWRPGAQKYAFAAAALGAIRPANASRSVRALGFAKHKCADLLGGDE